MCQSTTTIIVRIDMKFYTDTHGPQRINPHNFGDPLGFCVANTYKTDIPDNHFQLDSRLEEHLSLHVSALIIK